MAMELVTGYAGKAHVTSYQDAAIQAGIVGVDNGVLSYVGQGMKAVATSANNIRIYDGVALIGGKAVVIDRDTYQDVAIANGTVGKYRNDIIYIKYTKDAFTGVESVTFDVKQGAAGNSGIDPALTTNNLYSTGTLTSEIPFKRVRLNGLAIESVENMHDIVPSLSELNRNLEATKNNLSCLQVLECGSKIITTPDGLYVLKGDLPEGRNYVAHVINGDYNANSAKIEKVIIQDNNVVVQFVGAVNNPFRLNYVIFSVP